MRRVRFIYMNMSNETFLKELNTCLEVFKNETQKLRVGRAQTELVEGVAVPAYGSFSPLAQVATISAPEPRSLLIAPWDKSLIPAIEKAIRDANLGFQPVVHGEQIRIVIPPLTEERRHELAKMLNVTAESARVCIRRAREETMRAIDAAEKAGTIGEDEKFKNRDKAQEQVEQYNSKVEEMRLQKEKEIVSL